MNRAARQKFDTVVGCFADAVQHRVQVRDGLVVVSCEWYGTQEYLVLNLSGPRTVALARAAGVADPPAVPQLGSPALEVFGRSFTLDELTVTVGAQEVADVGCIGECNLNLFAGKAVAIDTASGTVVEGRLRNDEAIVALGGDKIPLIEDPSQSIIMTRALRSAVMKGDLLSYVWTRSRLSWISLSAVERHARGLTRLGLRKQARKGSPALHLFETVAGTQWWAPTIVTDRIPTPRAELAHEGECEAVLGSSILGAGLIVIGECRDYLVIM